jgi:hypothetical protein
VWQRSSTQNLSTSDAKLYCQNLDLGAYSTGWRLPAKKELETLVDLRVPSPSPAIDAAAFPGTPTLWFWTSTPFVGDPGQGWYVDFADGQSVIDLVGNLHQVRCVH